MLKGDRELMRRQNRALVVNLLRAEGPRSRTEIALRTGLAPSALTRLVRELLEDGFVTESGKTASHGGRPAVLVGLDERRVSSVGVKIERQRILAARVSLTGTISDRAELSFAGAITPEEAVEGIVRLVKRLAPPDGRTLGVGVGVSGFVDPSSGVDLFSPVLGWRNVPLRDALRERLRLPTWVENDVNALALAELWYGAGRAFRHFVVITVGEGVGAGVVIDGEVYRGAFGGAGEVGHVTINPDGPTCRCRERGCLEVYASDRFLLEEASRLGFASLDAMMAAARDGGADARGVFSRMGAYLGLGAKDIVNLLNPEAIVLGGERMDAADLFLSAFQEAVVRHSFPSLADHLQVVPGALGEDGFLIGPAALVAADFFHVPAAGGAP